MYTEKEMKRAKEALTAAFKATRIDSLVLDCRLADNTEYKDCEYSDCFEIHVLPKGTTDIESAIFAISDATTEDGQPSYASFWVEEDPGTYWEPPTYDVSELFESTNILSVIQKSVEHLVLRDLEEAMYNLSLAWSEDAMQESIDSMDQELADLTIWAYEDEEPIC